MTRNDFFNLLMNELQYIPEKHLQKILGYYTTLFETEMDNGKTEEEIINSLGNLTLLIDKIKSTNDYTIYNTYSNNSESSTEIETKQDSYYEETLINKETPVVKLEKTSPVSITNSTEIHSGSVNSRNKNNEYINGILKIGILILFIIITFPIISAVMGVILGLFGTALGLFTSSLGILIGSSFFNLASIPEIPQFISTLPYPALLFLCLGTMCLGIVLFFSLFYCTKAIFILLKHIFIKVLP